MSDLLIATFYQFVELSDFEALRAPLLRGCETRGIRGTILLAAEGLNGTISGAAGDVRAVLDGLRNDPRLTHLRWQEAAVMAQPFRRMKVRLEREIVTFGASNTAFGTRGDYVEPAEWNTLIMRPDVVAIDVRNHYEVAIGSFERAVNPHTRVFSELPRWIESERARGGRLHGNPTVAMFCTGGIRCEKSTAYLRAQGFERVFHLEGGILNYLKAVPEPQSLWRGECFVFDERISVRHGLATGAALLCHGCGQPTGVRERTLLAPEGSVGCFACAGRMGENRNAYPAPA